jgi:hypothetical protein
VIMAARAHWFDGESQEEVQPAAGQEAGHD